MPGPKRAPLRASLAAQLHTRHVPGAGCEGIGIHADALRLGLLAPVLAGIKGVIKNQAGTRGFFSYPVARAEHWTEQGKPRRGRRPGTAALVRPGQDAP